MGGGFTEWSYPEWSQAMMLMGILSVVVLMALIVTLPIWPHSKKWGFYPIGGVSLVILIVLVLWWSGHL